MYVYACVCMYVCMYVYTLYACTYICTCVCVCVCVCVSVYTEPGRTSTCVLRLDEPNHPQASMSGVGLYPLPLPSLRAPAECVLSI